MIHGDDSTRQHRNTTAPLQFINSRAVRKNEPGDPPQPPDTQGSGGHLSLGPPWLAEMDT